MPFGDKIYIGIVHSFCCHVGVLNLLIYSYLTRCMMAKTHKILCVLGS